ncbi:MAG: hypothetical protein JWM85_2517 [Acidimicrobiaceae bacterium]|nr:hypothetical protein [Acidimicrobiaceae bacterium]
MAETNLEAQLGELLRIPTEITAHREQISDLATRRRQLAERVVEVLGPTETAKRLGISRQTLWQILNPSQSKEIKRRSARRGISDQAT